MIFSHWIKLFFIDQKFWKYISIKLYNIYNISIYAIYIAINIYNIITECL